MWIVGLLDLITLWIFKEKTFNIIILKRKHVNYPGEAKRTRTDTGDVVRKKYFKNRYNFLGDLTPKNRYFAKLPHVGCFRLQTASYKTKCMYMKIITRVNADGPITFEWA